MLIVVAEKIGWTIYAQKKMEIYVDDFPKTVNLPQPIFSMFEFQRHKWRSFGRWKPEKLMFKFVDYRDFTVFCPECFPVNISNRYLVWWLTYSCIQPYTTVMHDRCIGDWYAVISETQLCCFKCILFYINLMLVIHYCIQKLSASCKRLRT